MSFHRNAKLGLAGRYALVCAVEGGMTLKAAALSVPRAFVPAILAVGVFDTGANVLVAFAVTLGAAGVVAVLSALYPLATVVLARVVLGERLDASRRMGGVVALAGASLVAAG